MKNKLNQMLPAGMVYIPTTHEDSTLSVGGKIFLTVIMIVYMIVFAIVLFKEDN